jgi:hypothetical protein
MSDIDVSLDDTLDPEPRDLTGELDIDDQEQPRFGQFFMDAETEDALFAYVDAELGSVILDQERSSFLRRIARYRARRLGIPENENKTFPWDGASNVVVPIAVMQTNGMFSLLKDSFKARDPFYEVRGTDKRFRGEAEGVSAALDLVFDSPNFANMRKKDNQALYDLGSLGTQFVKVRWNNDTRSWKELDIDGQIIERAQSRRSHPDVELIVLEDLYTRSYWDNVQTCPWVAHRIPYMRAELMALGARGVYRGVDDVLARGGDELDANRLELLTKLGFDPETEDENLFYVFEVHLSYDVDNDGVMEELVVWYDPVSRTRLRVDLNNLGSRMIKVIKLLEVPGSLYGLGVGGLVDNIQEEINDLHNMRNDSTMLSMLQMTFVKNGVQYGLQEGLRPGAVKKLGDPKNDVFITKYPDVSMSTIAAEQVLQRYAHQASAVTEDQLGFANSTIGTRETYSGSLLRAQNSSRVYAAMEESVKEGYTEIGIALFQQMLAHKDELESITNRLPEDKRQGFLSAMETPLEEVESKFSFTIKTRELERTEEAKRQAYLTLSQLYTMYAERILQLMQMVYAGGEQGQQIPPQVKEAGAEIIVGATRLLEKIMHSFGEEDTDDYLPYVRNLELMLEAMELQKDAQLAPAEQQLQQMKKQMAGAGAGGQGQEQSPMGQGAMGQGGPAGAAGAMSQGGPNADNT